MENELISIDEFAAKAVEWETKRPELDFDIDGLVVALVSVEDQEEAGWTGGYPNGKLAFKFKPEQALTIVRALDVQVGRTGVLTPMARVEPVYVAGSTISNITLHNYGRVKELNVDVGDEILVEKGGDIIPSVVRVTDRHGRPEIYWLPPESCPSCGAAACLRDNEIALMCFNPICPGKLEARIEYWFKTLEILGTGPAAIKALCSSGLVKDVSDLYYLSVEKVSQVLTGDVIPTRLVESILQKNQIPLWQFICALGIPKVGRTTSKTLAKTYKTLEAIVAIPVRQGNVAGELMALDDIGETIAENIIEGLMRFTPAIEAISRVIDIEDVEESSGTLVGQTFCITGSLPSGAKKAELGKRIEAAGGEMKSSVGKGLSYLILADPESTSAKAQKARKLGTECVSEEQVEEMMK